MSGWGRPCGLNGLLAACWGALGAWVWSVDVCNLPACRAAQQCWCKQCRAAGLHRGEQPLLPFPRPSQLPCQQDHFFFPRVQPFFFPLPLVILEGMKIIQLPDLLYSGWDGGQKSLGQKGWRGEACRNGCAVPSCSPRGAQCQAGVCQPCSLLVLQVVMVSMETSRTFPAPYDNGQAMSKAGG